MKKMIYSSIRRYFSGRIDFLSRPLAIYIKLTTKCMLQCRFCSQNGLKEVDIDISDIKKWLKDFKRLGVYYIYYTGGEPLLHKDFCTIIKYGFELGFYQIVVTNGVLLSNEKIFNHLKYIHTIGVSMHGTEDMHNYLCGNQFVYSRVKENLKQIHKEYKSLVININYTVVPENNFEGEFQAVLDFAKSINAKLSFARLNFIGNGKAYDSKPELNKVLEFVRENDYTKINISNCIIPCSVDEKYSYLLHGCDAGIASLAIEPNGDVKICSSSRVVLGNIRYAGIRKIWKCKELKLFRKANWLNQQCLNCDKLCFCKGGCHAEGSQLFWKENCDDMFVNQNKIVWELLKVKRLKLKSNKYRGENLNSYTLLNIPVRRINHKTLNLCRYLNGQYSGEEIIKKSKFPEAKEILITMYNDTLLELKDEF